MDQNAIITINQQTAVSAPLTPQQLAGQIANQYAAADVFADYLSRKADNTIVNQAAALSLFGNYLTSIGPAFTFEACDLQHNSDCWHGITWGIVEGFKRWLLREGFSIATVNNRLSVVKTYAGLANKAGVIPIAEYQQIKAVSGYSGKEAKRVNERRPQTRQPDRKKAEHVSLTPDQAAQLKTHDPETPQGRRDALLMALLLDHGLRVGEVAELKVTDIDLKRRELRFYRPKVDKVQTHQLTADTYQAVAAYMTHDALGIGGLILGSRKNGRLTGKPMSERAITKRVNVLGQQLLDIDNLSAHDCRHFWATDAARNGTDPFALRDAGGWTSLAMPGRYVEAAKIANSGVKLSSSRRKRDNDAHYTSQVS